MKDKNQWIEVVAFALPLLIASSLFFSCKQDKLVNDWTRMNLSGYVMTIKEHSFKAIDTLGEIVQGERMSPSWRRDSYIVFNRAGNKVEENFYRNDGKMWSKSVFSYDKNRKKIEEVVYRADRALWYTKITRFDSAGHIVEEEMFKPDNSLGVRMTFVYDESGNKIEECKYTDNGKLSIRSVFKYDKNRNKIEEIMYNSEGGQIVRWVSKYDAKGRQIEEDYYNAKNQLEAKETYQYQFDSKGNWTQQIIFEDDTPKYVIRRELIYY
jgi:hypothetical protein